VTTATTPAVWCGRCGKPARLAADSIDPRYPIVTCGELVPGGQRTGCGRMPGVTTATRAEDIRVARRRANVTRFHPDHIAKGRTMPDCDACAEHPPATLARIHDHADIPGRAQLMKHLHIDHADRAMLSHTNTWQMADLIVRHRVAHGR
jgi:hypothetical protein